MPDPRGFLSVQRRLGPYRPPAERLADHRDVHLPHALAGVREQARRCMGCAVPFCHSGCPLGNLVPDWNELVRLGRYREALDALHATNNFPEFTGRLCPAPCEESCVLALNDQPVTIKEIEWAIVDRGFRCGWIAPEPPARTSGRSVAVVGSGPAGLAAAQELARAGHAVVVYERDDAPGGLLRYGIPDFKLEKAVIDRRLEQLLAEGVDIRCDVEVGVAVELDELRSRHDAVLLAIGAQSPRDLPLPGRQLDGIHFAMPYLTQRNRAVTGREPAGPPISARGRRVVIIGGGDTSADCLGNALREGPASVVELAHGRTPPDRRSPLETWPEWPFVLRRYPVHEEGGQRDWEVATTSFGGQGRVERLHATRLGGGDIELPVDLVLLAIGFTGIEQATPLGAALADAVAPSGAIVVDDGGRTPLPGVYAAGDCARGADLIVTAIADGRRAARAIDGSIVRAEPRAGVPS